MSTVTEEVEEETNAPPPKGATRLRARMGATKKFDEGEEPRPPEENHEGHIEEERVGRGGAVSKPVRAARDKEDENLLAWLSSLAGDAPIRVAVNRIEPREFTDPTTGERKKVDGFMRRYDRPVDEDEIQKNHGGGTFKLTITKKDPAGRYNYFGGRTLEIAGDPKLNDVPRQVGEKPPAPAPVIQPKSELDSPVIARLLDHTLRPQAPAPAPDIMGAIQMAIGPFRDSIARLESQLERRDVEIRELRKGDPSKDDFTQKMLDKFVDQDSARLQQVRMQFESEIRMLKEQALATENRLRDGFERDKEALARSHQRELDMMKSANDLKVAALEQSFQLQKSVLEGDNRRLQREVDDLRGDVKELRNKKEPSFKDQISGMRDMKEMIEDVVGGGEEKEEKSTVTKFVEGLAQSDIVAGFAQKVLSGGGGQPMPVATPPQQQLPPPRRGPRLIRDRRSKQVYATDGRKMVPVIRRDQVPQVDSSPQVEGEAAPVTADGVPQAVATEAVPEQVQPEIAVPYIDPEVVANALDYMVKAFGNNVDPDTFVVSVKMFVPKDVIDALGAMGPEQFMIRVGNLPEDHALLTQKGKNWSRKVARLLVGES